MTLRAGFLFALLLLPACGFSPIYGDHGEGKPTVTQALGGVYIENIGGQQGQFLRNKLMDRFYYEGRPVKPTGYLSITMKSRETSLGIQKDATATRSQLDMTAKYTLRDQDKNVLITGSAHSVAGYSKLAAQYGTLATQRNAYDRSLIEISEQIANRLALYYAEQAPSASGSAPKTTPKAP